MKRVDLPNEGPPETSDGTQEVHRQLWFFQFLAVWRRVGTPFSHLFDFRDDLEG